MTHRFRTADKNSPAAKARARDYASPQHRNLRAAWQHRINSGEPVTCWRCHHPIRPGSRWHLGHDDHNRHQYRGPEHPHCNLKAAAQAGNKAQRRGRQRRAQSQTW